MTQQIRVRTQLLSKQPHSTTEIFNLTKHNMTWEQHVMGVVQSGQKVREQISELMSFDNEIPDTPELVRRARELAGIAKLSGCDKAMIGGPSFFMSLLEAYLIFEGIQPVFAFNIKDREGKFRFVGFVESPLAEWWLK